MKSFDKLGLDIACDAFLTVGLPDNWDEMSENERDDWIDVHRLAEFEGTAVGDVREALEHHGRVIASRLNDLVRTLEIALVDAAANDEVPQDMNNLNLRSLLAAQAS